VKFWGIGNEPWGDYQMGAMSLPQFELKHNLFAREMRKIDPSIKLIAGGAMPDVMEGADQARRINGQYVPDYLSAADWTGQMLLNCLDHIDMVSEHYYASGMQHTDMKLQKKVPIDPPLSLIEWERAPAVQVRAKYEHYQEYLKRIPALRAKPVPLAIDEWAYFGANRDGYKVVPAYAWAFHEMFRHSDVFQMGAFTFATAMMSEDRTEAILNPTGMLFKMYRDHFGTIPVEVKGDSPQPKPTFPTGGDQPAVNPGSDTYRSRCQRSLERRPEDPRHRRAQSLGLRTERQNRNRRDDPDRQETRSPGRGAVAWRSPRHHHRAPLQREHLLLSGAVVQVFRERSNESNETVLCMGNRHSYCAGNVAHRPGENERPRCRPWREARNGRTHQDPRHGAR
jgi:hypothetical protein